MARVGFVLPSHYSFSRFNGIREEALLKARGLQALGHSVELLSPWQPVENAALDVVHFFYGGLSLADIGTAREVSPRRLVFSTTIDSNQALLPYRAAAALGSLSKRLFTVQGEFRRQCFMADIVVVRSMQEQLRVTRGLGIPPSKVHVVLLGVDTDRVDLARVVDAPRNGVFHLSTFGQARKNVLRLIEAVGPTRLPLVIAGSCGPDMLPKVRRAADKYPSIEIRGTISDEERDDLYYSSRVFALPSLNEGTGLSALEAAARGCNVVITRNGGPPDYFTSTGILVDPLSVQDIRNAVLRAYAHTDHSAVATCVASQFSAARCAKQLADLYAA